MATITKKELVDRIAQRTESKHGTVRAVVQQFLDEIVSELAKGNRMEFRDFAVFEVRQAAPRTSQNPKNAGASPRSCKASSEIQDGAGYEGEEEWQGRQVAIPGN